MAKRTKAAAGDWEAYTEVPRVKQYYCLHQGAEGLTECVPVGLTPCGPSVAGRELFLSYNLPICAP